MGGRLRHLGLIAAVIAIALGTTGCWRITVLDGPGSGGGGRRTTDIVNADKSVAVEPVGVYSVPVITYADSSSSRLRFGVDSPSLGWSFTDLDGPGVAGGGGRTSDNVGLENSIALG